ncbi:VOC family protein [Stenotrophomonas sp. YIM B06876]|uniref:VOC family protein n=1 Tax=Stenotrophomonas sp. YIM B06876 TaxID=3060211 RepID=UPI0027382C8A|nr:VOC family protein [Stenotrophomonas sp. YIM B06876]
MPSPLPSPPALRGVLETALYVADIDAARRFYEPVMGLHPMHADARLVAYPLAPAQVLLLFQRGSTDATVILPYGTIPPHAAHGRQHVAFAIASDTLSGWEHHLRAHGIAVEGHTDWPAGGHSVYFRDPDQHLLELATPGLWRNY